MSYAQSYTQTLYQDWSSQRYNNYWKNKLQQQQIQDLQKQVQNLQNQVNTVQDNKFALSASILLASEPALKSAQFWKSCYSEASSWISYSQH